MKRTTWDCRCSKCKHGSPGGGSAAYRRRLICPVRRPRQRTRQHSANSSSSSKSSSSNSGNRQALQVRLNLAVQWRPWSRPCVEALLPLWTAGLMTMRMPASSQLAVVRLHSPCGLLPFKCQPVTHACIRAARDLC